MLLSNNFERMFKRAKGTNVTAVMKMERDHFAASRTFIR